MTIERRRVIVRGRVQGVGFRWFVRDVGAELGLDGWVRNLPDGRSVEAVAQGNAAHLERFVAALRRGPPGSFVSQLEEHLEAIDPSLDGFHIAH